LRFWKSLKASRKGESMATQVRLRVEMDKMTNLARIMGWEVEEELITAQGARIVLERNTETEKVVDVVRNKIERNANDLKVGSQPDLPRE